MFAVLADMARYGILSKSISVMSLSQRTLSTLAYQDPKAMLKCVEEWVVPTLSYSTLPHQVTGCLKTSVAVMGQLMYPKPYIAPHLPSLLKSALLGIDGSDLPKSLNTLIFYLTFLSQTPLENGQTASATPEDTAEFQQLETDEDRELWRAVWVASAYFDDWVFEFLERVFRMWRTQLPTSGAEAGGMVGYLEVANRGMLQIVLRQLFSQMSPTLFKKACTKVSEFAIGEQVSHAKDDIENMMSGLCAANPEVVMDTVLPAILEKTLEKWDKRTNMADSEVKKNKDITDAQYSWNLGLLRGLVRYGGKFLVPYQPALNGLVKLGLQDNSKPCRKLLQSMLQSLTATYTTDYRSLRPSDWTPGSLWMKWGKPMTGFAEADLKWHVPSPEEITFANNLVKDHVLPSFSILEKLVGGAKLDDVLPPKPKDDDDDKMDGKKADKKEKTEKQTLAGDKKKLIDEWKFRITLIRKSYMGAIAVTRCNGNDGRLIGNLASVASVGGESLAAMHDQITALLMSSLSYLETTFDRDPKLLKVWTKLSACLLMRKAKVDEHREMFILHTIKNHKKMLSSKQDTATQQALCKAALADKSPAPTHQANGSRMFVAARLNAQVAKRMNELGFILPRREKDTDGDGSKMAQIVAQIHTLTEHHYEGVRSRSSKTIESAWTRWPWLLGSQVSSLVKIVNQKDATYEQAVARLGLLTSKKTLSKITVDWKHLEALLPRLCHSENLLSSMPQEKASEIQKSLTMVGVMSQVQWADLPLKSKKYGEIRDNEVLMQKLLQSVVDFLQNTLPTEFRVTAAASTPPTDAALDDILDEAAGEMFEKKSLHWRHELHAASLLSCMLPSMLNYGVGDNAQLDENVQQSAAYFAYGISQHVQAGPLSRLSVTSLKGLLFSLKALGYNLLDSSEKLKGVLLKPEFLSALVQSIVKDRDDGGKAESSGRRIEVSVDELVKEPKRRTKDFQTSRKRGFGKDFYRNHAKLVKIFYQTAGTRLLPLLKAPLDALLACPEDKDERTNLATGAVLLAGLVRAATSKCPPPKNTPSAGSVQSETWQFVMPYFHAFFVRMSIGYCNDWADAVRYCFCHRTIASVQPLFECLVQKFDGALEEKDVSMTDDHGMVKTEEFAGKARWMRLVRAMLIELLDFKNTLVARSDPSRQKDVDAINDSVGKFWRTLLGAYGNPYQICREEIAKTIVLIVVENTRGSNPSPALPTRKEQIAALMGKLDLKEAKAAGCWPVGVPAVASTAGAGDDTEEKQDPSQDWCLETTIQIVYHCLNFCETFEVADVVLELLPAVLCSQNHKDTELCAMSRRCMKALIKNLRFSQVKNGECIESQDKLLTILQRLLKSDSRRMRGVVGHFAETLTCIHAQTRTNAQVNQVWAILFDKIIDDSQPEVQTQCRCGLTTFFAAFAGRIEGQGVKDVAEKFLMVSVMCQKDIKKKKGRRWPPSLVEHPQQLLTGASEK
jgi:hypothetical protein